jgi:hypothetical protein
VRRLSKCFTQFMHHQMLGRNRPARQYCTTTKLGSAQRALSEIVRETAFDEERGLASGKRFLNGGELHGDLVSSWMVHTRWVLLLHFSGQYKTRFSRDWADANRCRDGFKLSTNKEVALPSGNTAHGRDLIRCRFKIAARTANPICKCVLVKS